MSNNSKSFISSWDHVNVHQFMHCCTASNDTISSHPPLGKKRRVVHNSGPVPKLLAYWHSWLKALVAMGPAIRLIHYPADMCQPDVWRESASLIGFTLTDLRMGMSSHTTDLVQAHILLLLIHLSLDYHHSSDVVCWRRWYNCSVVINNVSIASTLNRESMSYQVTRCRP